MGKRKAAAKRGAVTKAVQKEIANAELGKDKPKVNKFQQQYDEECRKLNAARAAQSVEAIRLCGEHIIAIKKAAHAAGIVINISSDESFGVDEPHIRVNKDRNEAYFVCGDIGFSVDPDDLNKVLGFGGHTGVLDKLMDSQIMALARYLGLQVDPFLREVLLRGSHNFAGPLTGMLQNIWKRDVQGIVNDTLKNNHRERIDKYHRYLQ